MGKIIDRLFQGTLLVFIISMLTTTLGTLIDGMIISRFLGGISIAGMGIGNAYGNLITALSGIIAAGTQNVFSSKLGKGQMEEADGLLSLSALIVAAVSLATVGFTWGFLRDTAVFFGAKDSLPDVQRAAMDYIRGYSIGLPAVFGMAVMTPIMQLDSDRRRAVYAVTALSVTNIAGDLINIFVLRGGIFWVGATTAIAYYAGAGVLLLHFLRPEASVRLRFKSMRLGEAARIFYEGVPTAFNKFGTMFRNTLFNNISALAGGMTGLAANAIIGNLTALLSCLPKGFGSSTLTIGGMLHAEEDRNGLKHLLLSAFRSSCLISGAATALLLLFAPYIAMIYTDPAAQAYPMVVSGIRWYGLSMIPYSLSTVMINYYHSTRRIHLANLLNMADNFLFMALSVLALFRAIGMHAIWVAYFSGKVLTLAAIALGVSLRNRRPARRLEDFLLLREDYDVPEADKIDLTVTTLEEVVALSRRAKAFCLGHGIDQRKSARAGLCIEELVGNVVTHGFDGRGDRYVDVRVICKAGKVTIRLRDNCRKFNIKERYALITPDIRFLNPGISAAMGLAGDVKYLNCLNLNCLILQV